MHKKENHVSKCQYPCKAAILVSTEIIQQINVIFFFFLFLH